MSSKVTVCLRVRPLPGAQTATATEKLAPEALYDHTSALDIISNHEVILSRPFLSKQSYKPFDAVLCPSASQAETFERSCAKIIDTTVDSGLDGAVLAYGITGSGKSYSIWGDHEIYKNEDAWNSLLNAKTSGELPDGAGILPRGIHRLFENLVLRQGAGEKATVSVSMLQLYQEHLYDLLMPQTARTKAPQAKTLTLREDARGHAYAADATTVDVTSPQQLLKLLREAIGARFTAPTALNETSSRSHAIVQIGLKRFVPVISAEEGSIGSYTVVESKLTVIDLAGSERLKRAKLSSITVKEAASINKSIFTLGTVIQGLAAKSAGSTSTFVPFRNSVLTRMLKGHLDGSNNVCILACLSPSTADADETYGTLQFASRAIYIPTAPKVKVSTVAKDAVNLEAMNLLAFEAQTTSLGAGTNDITHNKENEGDNIAAAGGSGCVDGVISSSSTMPPASTHVTSVQSFLARIKRDKPASMTDSSMIKENVLPLSPSAKLATEFSHTLEDAKRAAMQRREALTKLLSQVDTLLHVKNTSSE